MKLTNILLLFALTSCTYDVYDELETSEIPEEIRPHYDNFFLEAEKRGVYLDKIPVRFVIVDGLGIAGNSIRGDQTIEINKEWVDLVNLHESNSINLEYVIFHELGHYQLNRRHLNDLKEDGTPLSMMIERYIAYTVGKEHLRDYYLDELFSY